MKGPDFRRVAIGPEHHRGGVLGMAALMTYLADGTRTLPMRRGTWVLRELLNDPPNNPPPNAGEIQPNTSGKHLTVRQRIELHRREDVCASCHAKLDPYGLALENYDAIGAWRERFNGEGYRGLFGDNWFFGLATIRVPDDYFESTSGVAGEDPGGFD